MFEPFLWNSRRGPLQPERLQGAPKKRLPETDGRPAGQGLPAMPVYIIAPESSLRLALARNLWLLGVDARPFADMSAFAAALPELDPGCLLLDTASLAPVDGSLPDPSEGRRSGWPTIMMFDQLDAEDAVRAVRLGASDLLCKPIAQDELIEALHRVAPKLSEQRLYDASIRARQAIEALSARERDVVTALKEGLSSKKIARELGLSPRTVEMYRNNIHRKLGVGSMAQLLKIAWLAYYFGEHGAPSPAAT